MLTLVINAFFVGAEFALISVRRSQIEPGAEAGNRRARSAIWGLEHVSALLAAAQLGITLCTLVLMIVGSLTYFDTVLIMTKGGPGTDTTILPYLMYRTGFQTYDLGYAAAIATALVVVATSISLIKTYGSSCRPDATRRCCRRPRWPTGDHLRYRPVHAEAARRGTVHVPGC